MGVSLPGSGISIGAGASGIQETPCSVTGTAATLANGNTLIEVGATAAFALTGPPSPPIGWEYTILDALGNASTFNITFTPQNSVLIEGQTNFILNTDRGSIVVYYNGTEFKVKAARG